VIIGRPERIQSTSSDEDFERERSRLQNVMMSLVERR
jgi:hypothetical protein